MLEGTSRVGGNSVGGTAPLGGGADGSLTMVYNEYRTHAAAKFSPRGMPNLATDNNILDQGLGCEENGRPYTGLTLVRL